MCSDESAYARFWNRRFGTSSSGPRSSNRTSRARQDPGKRERREALLRPVDLELEGTDADHVPRDALRGREDDALRVRISRQPGADPILRIDREIGETGKFVSQPMRNRGFVFLFEKEVLLPAHRLDVFDVRLVGLSRHWKFDNARDG